MNPALIVTKQEYRFQHMHVRAVKATTLDKFVGCLAETKSASK